jgi:hypothetical protein
MKIRSIVASVSHSGRICRLGGFTGAQGAWPTLAGQTWQVKLGSRPAACLHAAVHGPWEGLDSGPQQPPARTRPPAVDHRLRKSRSRRRPAPGGDGPGAAYLAARPPPGPTDRQGHPTLRKEWPYARQFGVRRSRSPDELTVVDEITASTLLSVVAGTADASSTGTTM